MKNYVKPSLEINKFAVEDIICASGVVQDSFTAGSAADTVYQKYLTDAETTAAAKVVEFQW